MKGTISYSDETIDFYAAEEKTVIYNRSENMKLRKMVAEEQKNLKILQIENE